MKTIRSIWEHEKFAALRRPTHFSAGVMVAIFGGICLLASCGGGVATSGGGGGGGGGGNGGGGGSHAIQIQRVEPSRVMVGVAIGLGTLVGTNFTSNSTVLLDGSPVQTIYLNPNLQFSVPDSVWNPPQSHTLQVSDPANGKSNVATFEVYAPQPGPRPFNGQLTQYMSESLIKNSLVPDVNGDGRADLILSTLGPNGLQSSPTYVPVIRHGQADGTFSDSSPLLSFPLQISPSTVISGDLNGDGYTDLILFGADNAGNSSYQVLLNDGRGNFSAGGSGSLPAAGIGSSGPILSGDFNHDGKLDFASLNASPIAIFFGNGDGTFAAPVPMGATMGGAPALVDTADLNGDGYTDIVYMATFYNAPSQIRLLLSAPDGSYTDSLINGLPSDSLGFVVGDFNNDHIPDIFALNGTTSRGFGQAYLGAGNGTFTPTGTPIRAFDGYLATFPFVAGDFDHDGNADVAIRNAASGPDEITFLWGDGKGNFSSQSIVSDHSFTLEVGDVNGDGITDIFAGGDSAYAYASVVLGQSGRNFPSAQTLYPNSSGPMSVGDVFGDGFTDLVVGGVYTGGPFNIPATIFHYQSNGTFAIKGAAPTYPTVLVDLNGDGIPDMVGFTGEEILIWKGDGTGVFSAPVNTVPAPSGFSQYYFRDMDKDGHMDIVLPGEILYGDGNFNFTAVTWDLYDNFAVGDFDGDGIPDIATVSGILFGAGNRTFTAPMGLSPVSGSTLPFPTQVVADLNGDGMDDLILGDEGPLIYLSTGRQGFALDQTLIVHGYAPVVSSVSVADFNGDGLPDIAVGMLSPEDVVIFTNDGTGKYQVSSYATGVGSLQSVAADLSHDGKPDLATENYYTYVPPTITVLLHK